MKHSTKAKQEERAMKQQNPLTYTDKELAALEAFAKRIAEQVDKYTPSNKEN